ncbi:SMI1/KNR4 family protein [Nocardia sp. NPDC003693]
MSATENAKELVRQIFDGAVAQGYRPESAREASDEEIDRMAARQNADDIPAAYREVLRIMGRRASLWFQGMAFGVFLDEEDKTVALNSLEYAKTDTGLRDPTGMLVIAEAEANFLVIDGADLHKPNPPVWTITDGNEVKLAAASVTDWFNGRAERLLEFKMTLVKWRASGRPDLLREREFRWE